MRQHCFVSLCLVVTACVAVPTQLPDERPFSEQKLTNIAPGTTARNDIRKSFGEPYETFGENRWWVFDADRRTAKWLVITGAEYGGVVAEIPGKVDRYYLLIEFDRRDVVRRLEVLHGDQTCNTDNSLCYSSGFLETTVEPWDRFEVVADECTVFAYAVKPKSPLSAIWITVDRNQPAMRFVSNKGYLRMNIVPGAWEIQAEADLGWGRLSESLPFECRPGTTHYFRVVHEKKGRAKFENVPENRGREEIRKRNLIVPQTRGHRP